MPLTGICLSQKKLPIMMTMDTDMEMAITEQETNERYWEWNQNYLKTDLVDNKTQYKYDSMFVLYVCMLKIF